MSLLKSDEDDELTWPASTSRQNAIA